MTAKQKNSLIELLASVQLALFLLFLLSTTAIIGTLIPQHAQPALYSQQYGPAAARFIQLLDIDDMYNSWWFLSLLTLFAINLIVCSADRLPRLIRLLKRDNLATTREQLERFSLQRAMDSPLPCDEQLGHLQSIFKEHGWKAQERRTESGAVLLFAQKAPWSRFGVYLVHASILIILVGAVVGSPAFARKVLKNSDFAYKGFVMLPERAFTDHVIAIRQNQPINLGFMLRCDQFHIEFYDNGMPKTYRSQVTVLEQGQEVLRTEIEVNKPLRYKGVTFYQSSYQPYQNYEIQLKKQPDGVTSTQIIPPAQETLWEAGGISYGIINRERQGEITRRVKLWLHDGEGEASQLWVEMGKEVVIERPSGQYLLNIKQMYATGLQAAKDPGVWLVYLGCLLMLVGLFAAFFLSHRKLFAHVQENGPGCRLLFAGTANKNKVQFGHVFTRMADKLEQR